MDAPSHQELESLRQAGAEPGDYVVQWQSAFGLIVIEVRGGETFVNGDKVLRAGPEQGGA
jgi:hypothetical protein